MSSARMSEATTAVAATTPDELSDSEVMVWRYADMCRHWRVSRATVERWVRRYEESGEGIPVHRDPSGRPYWLSHEASAGAVRRQRSAEPVTVAADDRLERLRRAAKRGRRTT